MLRLILTFGFLVFGIMPLWASSGVPMKDQALEQMFEYGKLLYERADRVEAAQVFKRIALYDPDYQPLKKFMLEAVPKIRMKDMGPIDPNDPNADLKQAMVREDAAIVQLKHEINTLRIGTEAHKYE